MSHTYLCLPSRSWCSFTDPGGMEGCVDLGDHLQLIKFWPSRAPGRGSVVGRKFLAPPCYSQRAVFASSLSAFSFFFCDAITKHSV